ncbi:S9 family peptidase [Belliella aquatica]|uniref:Acylaminoacyl-peptidase n=1 Tax=Belliella aquatica TaxID=1323734 RepID=A0ABQ1MH98_9BACT|nr:prolyl oligopeptidase family serine peptidase [Belliella aquatica]MCH7405102.1 prolyl oligopeptidase family serine peptidase [Belliella aquatica]GGC39747.1 acylaminoacyl-peptidase [Belliella aquatica]
MKQKMIYAFVAFLLIFNSYAQEEKAPKPMDWKDIPSWKSISTNSVNISPDGKWMAYAMLQVEGDGELIIKKTDDPSYKKTYKVGSSNFVSMAFSQDSKWIAFKEYPTEKEKKANLKAKKPLSEKVILLNLADDKKTEFDKVSNFSFNGEMSSHLALNLTKEGTNGDAKGSDLLLVKLSTGVKQNMGNVLEFSFNKSGTHLAYTVDAANQSGNGIYLMNVNNGTTQVLDSDAASYKSINWTEKGDAFALLKLVKDKKYKQDQGKLIGVKNLTSPQVTLYDPLKDSVNFAKAYTISPNRRPQWSEDLSELFYGIHPLVLAKKEDEKSSKKVNEDSVKKAEEEKLAKIMADTSIKSISDLQKAIAKADSTKSKPSSSNDDLTKPDMTIWHWQDARLQSRQQVLENQDKNYSFWAMYDIKSSKHTALQDSSMKELTLMPKEKYALGADLSAYELDINLDGQNYRDIYLVDLSTGDKKMLFEKFYLPSYSSFPRSSPDGTKMMYGFDGHYYIYDLAKGTKTNITESLPTTFVDVEDDHNVTKPLHGSLGWSHDSNYVLLRDGWDIWQVPLNPKEKAINLTKNGKSEKIRYQSRFVLDDEEKGYDWKKTQYFRTYGEKSKKSGIVKIDPSKSGLQAGVKTLIWEDANINRFSKAKSADVFYFTKENFNKPTEFFLTDSQISKQTQITENTPDAGKYLWSSGAKLIDYISDKGDSLQGALFLPANYQEGKKYPTIIYYYEKLSQTLHNYNAPGFSGTGWNPNIYTSNGYAVFIPDIVYTMDDPGMSAVWCVLPGVKEAIKSGVIDESRMGLHGHSWGGYQTSFLITQTDMFKAAAAGAPLTNMISMYDLIYWNSGGGNMSIFEASQGRFKGAPWENWESYQRNSPVYHVKNVKTPLLMLHNDKDGAVDFTQGIEYYNALRRLKKPVIMVQYQGENHGLSKLENRKDYSVRMMEFFDHHLKEKDAPDWIASGVDKLKLEEHLETRVFGNN